MATPIKDWREAGFQLDSLATAIQKDLVPLLSFPEGAPYTVIREWACYVDHLGSLFSGEIASSQKRFRLYLREVLSEVDSRYRQRSDLLLQMFRHGTVHEFDPKVLVNTSGERLGSAVITTPGRNQTITLEDSRSFTVSHLDIAPHIDLHGQFALWVSTHCLVGDLLESIKVFKTGMNDVAQRVVSWNKTASESVKPTAFNFNVT